MARSKYDVPVEGIADRYFTMSELMEYYHGLASKKEWSKAFQILEYTADCGHIPAILEMAKVLVAGNITAVQQSERHGKAEALLRRVMNRLDVSDKLEATVAVELAKLYGNYMNRPVGYLAMLLKAKRLGHPVLEGELSACYRKISRIDINSFGNNPQDAYELACELEQARTADRFTELLLRECIETGNKMLQGMAALELADFYYDRQSECLEYRREGMRYERIASECGFGRYISSSL